MGMRLSKLIITVCLIVSVISILFVMRSRGWEPKRPSPDSRNNPYALPVAKAGTSNEASVESPDGKLTLKMQENKGKEGTTYIFWISGSDGSAKEIFRKTTPLGSALSIPFNTFSPDGKYVFLKEANDSNADYLVLSVAGTWLTKDSQTLEISGLFADKYPDYKITDATGWGGPTLVVINTDRISGGEGPSFWFDVGSRSFIQLSNRFD
jgi:hypothetical protein